LTLLALLDSNVVVATQAATHQYHAASLALLDAHEPDRFAIAPHSYAEAYVTLMCSGPHAPLGYRPANVWAGLEHLRTATALLGLTPAETIAAVRAYAASGGIGARLYDTLIGHVAVAHRIPAIVTWNRRHMAGLFPRLRVATPAEF
jgi:predicted nucleic acid-binding protein